MPPPWIPGLPKSYDCGPSDPRLVTQIPTTTLPFSGSLRRPPTPHPLIKVFFMPAEWEGRSLTPGLVPSAPHSLVSGSPNPLTLAPQIRGLFLFTEHLRRPTRQGYPDTWF